MNFADKVVVVTGGAAGMGEGMCRRFAAAGARVVVADIDVPGSERVAEEVGGLAVPTDVAVEDQVQRLVTTTISHFGVIDAFVSNAGILWGDEDDEVLGLQERGNPWASNAAWQRVWDVNVMPQVYAARAVLPHMLERGRGYLVQNASAAGLLTALGNAPYTTSKHAVLGLVEWLSIHYGDRGVAFSVIASEGIRTDMLDGAQGEWFAAAGAITADEAAEHIIEGMRRESFLILPHPKVEKYFLGKATDYDGWLTRMRRLHAKTPEAST